MDTSILVKHRPKRTTSNFVLMGTPDWSRGVHIAHRALADLPSSQLYLLAIPNLSEQLKLPVHDFIAHSPGDPLRKINNLAAVQFTTLFHGYTSVVVK